MFSKRLKEARQAARLSQRALAEKLYISQQAYARYENGTSSPTPETLSKISAILDVSISKLLDDPGVEAYVPEYEDYPNRIKELRIKHGLTQMELAKQLNVSQAALSGYETGKYQADNSTYLKIADLFHVSLDFLLKRPSSYLLDEEDSSNMSDMYNRIAALCEKKKITPGKLCTETGLSRSLLTELKSGRTRELSAKNVKKISDYFNVSAAYLLGEDSPPKQDLFAGLELPPMDLQLFAEKNKPAPMSGDELDSELIRMLTRLSPEEMLRVDAFVQGLIAGRKD